MNKRQKLQGYMQKRSFETFLHISPVAEELCKINCFHNIQKVGNKQQNEHVVTPSCFYQADQKCNNVMRFQLKLLSLNKLPFVLLLASMDSCSHVEFY